MDIFIIFLISGLKLKTDDVRKALTSYRALMYGAFAILVITPCVAFGLVRLDGELSVPEFAFGIAVFALMPTTLSSGVILTRDANGNVPISLMLTVSICLAGNAHGAGQVTDQQTAAIPGSAGQGKNAVFMSGGGEDQRSGLMLLQ